MEPTDLAERLTGMVHEDTQVHDRGVDLTVAEVYVITAPGRVDFGGGELEDPAVRPHNRVWRRVDDDYQWWYLESGTYLVDYNETVDLPEAVRLEPRQAVVERGGFHPTLTVEQLDRIPLTVPDDGLRIKENARVSTLVPTGDEE